MKASVIFDSRTHTTEKAAGFIAEGIALAGPVEARCFRIDSVDEEFARASGLIILGSPTYMASATAAMHLWLEQSAPKLSLAGKLGGAFATEQYIHGGAENTIAMLLTHMLVCGMMAYSGGGASGKPVIHLGPVGMSQDIESFHELFTTYGRRMGAQLLRLGPALPEAAR